jgi:hypothetical protein
MFRYLRFTVYPLFLILLVSCIANTERNELDPRKPLGAIFQLLPLVFPDIRPSSTKELKTFYFSATNSYAVINGTVVKATVPYSTNLSSMTADFFHTGVSVTVNHIEQKPNQTTNNFETPLTFRVHAKDTTFKDYTVTVEKGLPDSKDFLNYQIDSINVKGIISGNTVQLYLPTGTDTSSLVSIFSHSGKQVYIGSIEQIAGQTVNDFSQPLVYTVIADDNSKKEYTVFANLAPADSKELKAFTINNSKGQIVGNDVIALFPTGTDVSSLSAVFAHTGKDITVNGVSQVNGETLNNFSSPVVYTVIAQDGSTQNYTVKVSLTKSSFTIGGTLLGLSSGNTLVLQNNGESISISNNGSFQFTNLIEYGNVYSVSIMSQPIGQTCVVQESGGVANYNITNILVSCTTNTYTISGQLTGLTSGTVSVQNNGGDTIQLSSDSSFVFSTPLTHGNSYLIHIVNQPIDQVCTVTNSSGIATETVSNINVTCATSQYTIGGYISGLGSGESVVLQNNSGDDLTLTANSSFSFATKLNYGSSYSVSILTQPDGQYCSVTNGSGTTGSDVNSVNIDCNYLPGYAPQSFTDNGDGTIKDNNTGLVWMKCSMSNVSGVPRTGNDCSGGTIGHSIL